MSTTKDELSGISYRITAITNPTLNSEGVSTFVRTSTMSTTAGPAFDPVRHIKRTTAAKRVNRTVMTLRRWEAAGRLNPIRFNSRVVGYDKLEFEMVAQEVVPTLPIVLGKL